MNKYGWKPELPDHRDRFFAAPPVVVPAKADIGHLHRTVYNQLSLGSCTAQGIALGYDFALVKAGLQPFIPSRLFIYYNERKIEGTINYDAGATIRNGIKTISKEGVCVEKDWPYKISKFKSKPPLKCYNKAKAYSIDEYLRLDNRNLNSLKACIADGFGFVFGFSVYQNFESMDYSGLMAMPEGSQLGGHAVFAVGYDDETGRFKIRNSWGSSWGHEGHFYMPYAYINSEDLCADFWTIKVV